VAVECVRKGENGHVFRRDAPALLLDQLELLPAAEANLGTEPQGHYGRPPGAGGVPPRQAGEETVSRFRPLARRRLRTRRPFFVRMRTRKPWVRRRRRRLG